MQKVKILDLVGIYLYKDPYKDPYKDRKDVSGFCKFCKAGFK